ncbi:MAG: hypothetical protein JO297_13685 [Nitrososphaeraceae archaeon]|nr:hypothetical protein [Nitrososphaeraceae archaeon]
MNHKINLNNVFNPVNSTHTQIQRIAADKNVIMQDTITDAPILATSVRRGKDPSHVNISAESERKAIKMLLLITKYFKLIITND